MKRFLIIGAGRQARACAAFLLEQFERTHVTLIDRSPEALAESHTAVCGGRPGLEARVRTAVVDSSHDHAELRESIRAGECVLSCVPYFLNDLLTDLSIQHRKPFCDLGGNKGTVQTQLRKSAAAKEAGVCVVPDCGLAPGAANVLAEYWRGDWSYRSVRLYCGGLPQHPANRLKYAMFFSPWGLFNEYFDECEASRDGQVVTLPGLSEPEELTDLPVPGVFEAFHTSGGASIGPQVYAPKGVDYQYKTIRYAGHRDIVAAMHELGYFEDGSLAVTLDGRPVGATMRELSAALFEKAMPSDRRDVVIVRVVVEGESGGRPCRGQIDLVDRADGRFTAMERTTGFSLGIVAAQISGLYGPLPEPGAYVPFQVLPPTLLIQELRRAGVTGFAITP